MVRNDPRADGRTLRILPRNGKDRNHRLLAALVVIGFLGLDKLAVQTAHAGPPLFQVTDISPDTPYNTPGTGGAITGGRTIQIVIDPTNESTLYLATDIAGVWKSTDAGQHWAPANNGIRNPMTTWADGRRPLAIDDTNPQRLLYATSNDDLRANHPWGGLYFTDVGAGTWHHVDLPSCSDPSIGDVLFSGGTSYVSTRCGMFTGTGDLSQTANWNVTAFPSAASGWQIAVSGSTQFACLGTNVYRRTGGSWSAPISVGGGCWDITVSPDAPDSQAYIVEWQNPGWSVQAVDFGASSHTQLGNNPDNCGGQPCVCCGQASVWTVPRPHGSGTGPGHSFDVFVSDMFDFSQYDASTSTWKPVFSVHPDTFTMAFPPSYDPDQGTCTAYMTNDGGVHKNLSSGVGCALWDGSGQWVAAMSGLHTLFAYTMAVVPWVPGPAIYLPSGDNETWGTLDGGGTWQDMGCCGDSGKAVVDLGLPQQMVTMRNGYRQIYRSAGGAPPQASDNTVDLAQGYQYSGKDLYDGAAPPSQGAFAQVMTPAGGTAENQGDYLQAVAKLVPPDWHADPTATNEIIRTTTGTQAGWRSVSAHFMGADIGSIQPSGGHTDTIVYVMTFPSAGGHLFRAQVSGDAASGTIPDASWQQLPFTGQAAALFANPYDPNVLYTYDMSVSPGKIFSSANAGQTWTEEADLMRILTRNHEFVPTCNHAEEFRQTNYSCTLNNVFFDRNDPNIRVVSSVTGAIAFSRDGGGHWISLNDAVDPNTRPSVAAYDATINPITNAPSLYYDALNLSMTRIDAPFPTLESATYELHGLDPGHAAFAVNATTGKTTELTREGDGVYRGYDDVFDSAVFSALSYRLDIDGQSTVQFAHTLTDAEKAAGVVELAPGSDLSITKTAPDTAIAGTNLTYTITLTNNGPEGAQDVGITDTLPAEVTFVSATPSSGGQCTTPPVGGTGDVSCTWSGLTTPPASHSVDIVVHVLSSVASGTVISNTASIVSLNPDPDGTNNSRTATTGVVTQADLAVTKNEAHKVVLPGTQLQYTIVVRNDGPSDAKDATLTDTLPANTKLLVVSAPAGWLCTSPPGGTGTLTCTVPSLAFGASATFVVGVRVNDGLPNGTEIINAVTVSSSSDLADPTANNDLASTTAVSYLPVPTLDAVGLLACVLLLAGVAVRFLYRGRTAGM